MHGVREGKKGQGCQSTRSPDVGFDAETQLEEFGLGGTGETRR